MAYGVNGPFGLQPRRSITGAAWNGAQNNYLIASSYNTSLFTGDPVKLATDGTIVIAAAGDTIIGVFQGCKYFNAQGTAVYSPYWPANTATFGTNPATAFVMDDPNVLVDVQVSNSANVAVNFTQANLNDNYNFSVGGGGANLVPQNPAAGSTVTGQSAYYLDINSIAHTATLNLTPIAFTPYPGNGPSVAGKLFPNVMCIINNHQYKGGTGNAGV